MSWCVGFWLHAPPAQRAAAQQVLRVHAQRLVQRGRHPGTLCPPDVLELPAGQAWDGIAAVVRRQDSGNAQWGGYGVEASLAALVEQLGRVAPDTAVAVASFALPGPGASRAGKTNAVRAWLWAPGMHPASNAWIEGVRGALRTLPGLPGPGEWASALACTKAALGPAIAREMLQRPELARWRAGQAAQALDQALPESARPARGPRL